MATVVLTGSSTALGQRVRRLVEADEGVDRVVTPTDADVESNAKRLLEGVDGLVHLAFDDRSEDSATDRGVEATRRLLDGAGGAGVPHLVVLSSAAVYGAWPNNPVPLTEEAPLRPNPGLEFAVQRAEVERLVAEWEGGHPGSTVAVLRPVPALAEEATGWMARALVAASAMRAGDDPPAQFVHLDDLASAVDLARRERLRGPFNVAPDGWIPGESVRALAGPRPRLRLPEPAAKRFAGWTRRLRLGPATPGVIPYVMHPWVVANDRLRAAGWEPAWTNEEAFVAGHQASPLATMSPKRRQELALAGVGVAVAAAAAGAGALIRRRRS
jgi:nucleoside-diphosphate-sugar epimerase